MIDSKIVSITKQATDLTNVKKLLKNHLKNKKTKAKKWIEFINYYKSNSKGKTKS
jgi:hypothetical protein